MTVIITSVQAYITSGFGLRCLERSFFVARVIPNSVRSFTSHWSEMEVLDRNEPVMLLTKEEQKYVHGKEGE